MKINYLAKWDKNSPELTWSGTTWHLYHYLSFQNDVNRIDITKTKSLDIMLLTLIQKFANLFLKGRL
ncbi:hypothetical protein [Loigolactobacillus binensis]|uniref:Uncharacterized protein n=1 Tax=Loigolactobacillus binensis TaxID=2559922 RepID=A0ABW3EAZ5_9LACO|nr:hypothetical protein [Loigolactobacillus binensis]